MKESAFKVLTDIQNEAIFDDIKIDFDNITESIKPQADQQILNQMLVSYYEEIHDVLQKRLEECSDIIEEFYMHKINEYKEEIVAGSSRSSKSFDITSITNEHHEQLKALRLQYDNFLQNAETEFFDVLR